VPIAESRGAWIRWRTEGRGEPVLLVMGLAGSSRAWARLWPHLAAHCRPIAFDHRGTGDSDRVRGLQTMGDMVADCLAVLDAAGQDSAHVVAVSMGGMVAQHLALDHPERVRSLVLGSTTAGGLPTRGRTPWQAVGTGALRPVLGARRSWPLFARVLYARHTREEHPERIEEDLAVRADELTPTSTSVAQLAAIARHDVRDRLHELAGLPVTVLHGDEDRLVPLEAGRALAQGIPGARFRVIPGSGHMMTTDAEQAAADAVLEHLAELRASARAA
jgi:pimeloyl-ACP methyl ester carboxylesterase